MESKVCFAIKKDKNTGRMQDEIRLLKKILEFLFNEREKVLNTFKRNIFPMKVMDNNAIEKRSPTTSKIPIRKQTLGTRIKILTPKKILHGFPITLVQVKIGNTSENLLNRV